MLTLSSNDRLVDSSRSDILRGDSIRRAREATAFALELIAGATVRFFCMRTRWTFPRRVARVNQTHGHPGALRFVANLRAKIGERPGMELSPLGFPSRYPVTNTAQFFERDSSAGAFSLFDNLFGNYVVYVASMTRFFTLALCQQSFRRLRSLRLQLGAKARMTMAQTIQMRSAVIRAIGIRQDVDDTKVATKPSRCLVFPFIGNVHCDIEKPFAISQNQIGLTARQFKKLPLILSTREGNLCPPLDCPNAHGGFEKVKIEYARIIGDAAMLAKNALASLVDFIGIGNLGVQQANNLSRQGELIPNLTVKSFVQWEAAKLFRFPGKLREAIRRTVGDLQSLSQIRILSWRRQKFYLHGQFHGDSLSQRFDMSNINKDKTEASK